MTLRVRVRRLRQRLPVGMSAIHESAAPFNSPRRVVIANGPLEGNMLSWSQPRGNGEGRLEMGRRHAAAVEWMPPGRKTLKSRMLPNEFPKPRDAQRSAHGCPTGGCNISVSYRAGPLPGLSGVRGVLRPGASAPDQRRALTRPATATGPPCTIRHDRSASCGSLPAVTRTAGMQRWSGSAAAPRGATGLA